jgi:hypothetical protein
MICITVDFEDTERDPADRLFEMINKWLFDNDQPGLVGMICDADAVAEAHAQEHR